MSSLGQKALTALGTPFSSHEYDYRQKGADVAAEALGLPLDAVFKSLVVALADGSFVFLLTPAGRSASMKAFARTVGTKSATLASERDAERLTGYSVGGIGPFGARTTLPVYIDLSVLDHDRAYVNGGRRGLILGFAPEDLIEAAQAELVEVA